MMNTAVATTANAVKSTAMIIPAIAPSDSPLSVPSLSSPATGSSSTSAKPARTNVSILSYKLKMENVQGGVGSVISLYEP